MSANFDLSALSLQACCPRNDILYDDQGMPSIMVRIPKMTFAQLGLGESNAIFPAFIVNGQEVDELYISKYQNVVQNNRAYSLPGVLNTSNVIFDTAAQYCKNKGEGWHLMTAFEWGLMINLCEKMGINPLGNVNRGIDYADSTRIAIPGDYENGNTRRTLTGTGPLTWFHDHTPSGIADLCGNVWEWTGGMRNVYGEIQILNNNNIADPDHSQSATSTEWRAIDATTGELVEPNGSGTTTNSIKMDYLNSKYTWNNVKTNDTPGDPHFQFYDIACTENISDDAKFVLRTLGLLARESSVLTGNQVCHITNTQAERLFVRGGNYGIGWAHNGLASFYGATNFTRSHAYVFIGFRSAFIKLPTA